MNKYIEHTLLKPTATNEALAKLYEEAKEHNFRGVCVNPINVKKAAEALKSIRDEMIKAGLPEELVDELLLRSINGGE